MYMMQYCRLLETFQIKLLVLLPPKWNNSLFDGVVAADLSTAGQMMMQTILCIIQQLVQGRADCDAICFIIVTRPVSWSSHLSVQQSLVLCILTDALLSCCILQSQTHDCTQHVLYIIIMLSLEIRKDKLRYDTICSIRILQFVQCTANSRLNTHRLKSCALNVKVCTVASVCTCQLSNDFTQHGCI